MASKRSFLHLEPNVGNFAIFICFTFHIVIVAVNHVSPVRLGFTVFQVDYFFSSEMIDMKVLSRSEYETANKKKQMIIHFGFHQSPFGTCLIGLSSDRICHLSFVNETESKNLSALASDWPGAELIRDESKTTETVKNIFQNETQSFKVLLKGTPFERKVWQTLLDIPKGETKSYQQVAAATGRNRAVRAAANAIAKNPVAYLVPCHRVIRKDGQIHKYGWGSQVKKKMLEYENCHF